MEEINASGLADITGYENYACFVKELRTTDENKPLPVSNVSTNRDPLVRLTDVGRDNFTITVVV